MALNAYARAVTDRAVVPVAKSLVRVGATANWLTFAGLLLTLAGVATVLAGSVVGGATIMAVGLAIDALDGTVARLRGETSPFGSFYDSVADRIGDAAIFGALAWIVRATPLLFGLAILGLAGALITSYVRAKAESLGWNATVGVIERPERVIVVLIGLWFDLLPLALWVLAIGSLVTVTQRLYAVWRQAGGSGGLGNRAK